jgi:hypothetical protein
MRALGALIALAILLSCTLVAAEPIALALVHQTTLSHGQPGIELWTAEWHGEQGLTPMERTELLPPNSGYRAIRFMNRGGHHPVLLHSSMTVDWAVSVVAWQINPDGSFDVSSPEVILDEEIVAEWPVDQSTWIDPDGGLVGGADEHIESDPAYFIARHLDPTGSLYLRIPSIDFDPEDLESGYLSRSGGQSLTAVHLASGEEVLIFDGALDHRTLNQRPQWSPDGSRVAFHTRRAYEHLRVGDPPYFGLNDWRTEDLQVWDVELMRTREIVPRGFPEHISGAGRPFPPSWAPDGQRLVFAHRNTDPHENFDPYGRLWYANLETEEVRELSVPLNVWQTHDAPTWFPDESAIVVQGHDGEDRGYHLIDLETDRCRNLWITSLTSPQRQAPAGLRWCAITPDGTHLLGWSSRTLYCIDLREGADTMPERLFTLPEGSRVLDAQLWTPSPLPQWAAP